MSVKNISFSITIVLLFISGATSAQGTPEYLFSAGGGVSTILYQPPIGKRSLLGFGGTAGVGFNYLINRQIGVGVGIEAALYTSRTKADGVDESYSNLDAAGRRCMLNININDFVETQQIIMLNIPVTLNYRFGKGLNKYYIAAGVKIGVYPLMSRYSNDGATLTTSAVYDPPIDLTADEQKDLGYGEFNVAAQSGELDLLTNVSATVEFGIRWRFNKNKRLYTGIYADYGLSDIKSDKQIAPPHFAGSNPTEPSEYTVNSAAVMADKLNTLSAGIVLRFAFGPNETRGRGVRSPNIFSNDRPVRPSGSVKAPRSSKKEPQPGRKPGDYRPK